MSDALDLPLRAFQTDLQRLEHLLAFVTRMREFGGVEAPSEVTTDAFYEAAAGMREEIRGLSADFPIFSGTLLLFLAGRFEHFVRVSFENMCDAFAAKCHRFDQLPDKMSQALISATAEVLAKPAKYGYDEVQTRAFVKTLSENLDATEGLSSINSAVLSLTESNMNPSTLGDLYKRAGLTSIWGELSKQARLKLYFESDNDRDVERQAKSELESLMRERNRIAHPTDSPSFPDTTKVLRYLTFLRVLADVLTDVSRMHLVAFKVTE
jgi:hypothetical protein